MKQSVLNLRGPIVVRPSNHAVNELRYANKLADEEMVPYTGYVVVGVKNAVDYDPGQILSKNQVRNIVNAEIFDVNIRGNKKNELDAGYVNLETWERQK